MKIKQTIEVQTDNELQYTKQVNLVRTILLVLNDGLISNTSLMMGVVVMTHAHIIKSLLTLFGFIAALVGAFIMAVAEFNSTTRRNKSEDGLGHPPLQVAIASVFVFLIGGMIPIIVGLCMHGYVIRLGFVGGAISLGLGVLGCLGAFLGSGSHLRVALRVILFAWVAMAFTLGLFVPQW
ncbi:unnamed protein product [Amaranthus hypochondriacus]